MNTNEAGEGWLQIGDNLAGIIGPAEGVHGVHVSAEAVTQGDVSSAHQFFNGANGADMTQFPDVTMSGAEYLSLDTGEIFSMDSSMTAAQAGPAIGDGGLSAANASPAIGDASMSMAGADTQLVAQTGQMLNSLIEMATNFAGGGMLGAILNFLAVLFSPQNMLGMLDPARLYAQAAAAAQAALKKGLVP